jgi:hypothetical protein
MKVDVKINGLKALMNEMSDLEKKQLPFAMAKTLTKTAQQIKEAAVKEMSRTLDRPTPYTLGSLYIKTAKKKKLTAMVYFKDKSSAGKGNPAANFLFPQVEGGQRNLKRFESSLRRIGVLPKGLFVVPGNACPLDAHGNIPSSLIVQILSYFQAFGEQGYRANITDKRKKSIARGSKKQGFGFEYFVSYGPGTWSGRQHLPAGIYKRVKFSVGTSIKPIMMFTKEPKYKKRFPFYEVAQKTLDQNLIGNFNEAMDEAVKTAK